MPAVHTFSQYAALAVVLNFILQITLLLAVVTLDFTREYKKYVDVLCCIRAKTEEASDDCFPGGILYYVTKEIYAPFLMLYPVRVIVVSIFSFK